MRRPLCLITAGPTREYIDPVRYISNASSGKMGFALADEAAQRGWRVIVIAGPIELPAPNGVTVVPVISARQMHRAALRYFAKADIVIGAAAVADWRPVTVSKAKLKKSGGAPVIRLCANPDILKEFGSRKKHQVLAGFALESHRVLKAARAKLKEKNLDLIVANTPAAIGRDASRVTLIDAGGGTTVVCGSKSAIAKRILDAVYKKTRHI